MRMTDAAVPLATTEVHGGIEYLRWEKLGIADSPGLGVRFADGSAVSTKSGTDQGHHCMMPPGGVSPTAGSGTRNDPAEAGA
jgi:hypothetical protein